MYLMTSQSLAILASFILIICLQTDQHIAGSIEVVSSKVRNKVIGAICAICLKTDLLIAG
jgi:hypothetical protein